MPNNCAPDNLMDHQGDKQRLWWPCVRLKDKQWSESILIPKCLAGCGQIWVVRVTKLRLIINIWLTVGTTANHVLLFRIPCDPHAIPILAFLSPLSSPLSSLVKPYHCLTKALLSFQISRPMLIFWLTRAAPPGIIVWNTFTKTLYLACYLFQGSDQYPFCLWS